MISLYLCDPQPIVHLGLRGVLEECDDVELAGYSAQLSFGHADIIGIQPTVAVIDRSYGMHGLIEMIGQLKQRCPETEVIIWASSITDVECFRALQAGALGILRKTASTEIMIDCFRSVANRELWTENLYFNRETQLTEPRSRPLTPRETEVAELVSKGMKNREIGEALGIATGTVKIHLMHIFEKTGIRDRFELALQGLRLATERDRKAVKRVSAVELAPVE